MYKYFNKAVESHLDRGYFESSSYRSDIEIFLNAQVAGDLAFGDDVTTDCLAIKDKKSKCKIVSKDDGIFCGGYEVKYYFEEYCGMKVKIDVLVADGDIIKSGDVLVELSGRLGDIFILERVTMNIIQRMSGIATLTDEYRSVAGNEILICPTRKTLLGSMDKKACLIGGGGTHRIGLHDAVLFKKTHIDSVDRNFNKLLNAGFSVKNDVKFVECEVESVDDATKIIEVYGKLFKSGIVEHRFVIMFDNLDSKKIKLFLENLDSEIRDSIIFEASGGIDLENIANYAKSGVDIISVGNLTNGVRPLDFSFRLL